MAKINQTETTIKGKIINGVPIKGKISHGSSIRGMLTNDITDASTTKKGVIRIATDEEAVEGLSENTTITPHTLKLVTHYVHEQGIASDIWEIEHNLNKEPSVTVVDTANEEQIPDKKVYNSQNKVTLYFLSEFAGRAILN